MTRWDALLKAKDYYSIVQSLVRQLPEGLAASLRANPRATVESEIAVEERTELPGDCNGGGYYSAKSRTIYLHPASPRRNNFTLIHEFGHHQVQRIEDLNFALLDLSPDVAKLAEEAICDEFASEILVPLDSFSIQEVESHPARLAASLYRKTAASRSAVIKRIEKKLPKSARWIFIVLDSRGCVTFSTTTYSDSPPRKESSQPFLHSLALSAASGPIVRPLERALSYSNGSYLGDLTAYAAPDHEGSYTFIALTPTSRFGPGNIYRPDYDCSNPGCNETFFAGPKCKRCFKCKEPLCPSCGTCACSDSLPTNQYCPKCRLLLSPEEIKYSNHEC